MPQVCGVENLYPSESLYPSDYLAPGSGKIFVPKLPLAPGDFPIDDTAAIFVATDDAVSLARFYAQRMFNDLPEYLQGLPLRQLPNRTPLPEYKDDPDNIEARWWGMQRICLRAIARELARIDYILRGRVSLMDYATTKALPHATPPDDNNLFELVADADQVVAPASYVDPASVRFPTYTTTDVRVYDGDTTNASPTIQNMTSVSGLRRGTPISGAGIPAGAYVVSVDSTTKITISAPATATASGVSLSFTISAVHPEEYRTNKANANVSATGTPGTRYVFAHRINDQQQLDFNATTGGTFTLALYNEVTSAIAYPPSAADVQDALEHLANVDVGDVAVSGPTGGPLLIDWKGGLAGTDVRQLDVDGTLLTGPSPEVTVTTNQDGEAGFSLVLSTTTTPPDVDSQIIGEAVWDGTNITSVTTYPEHIGEPADGYAYYNPFEDPQADNGVNPACTPLSQNEGVPAQFFSVTANWGLDLWEEMLGLEVPSKNPVNTIQYPERRARILKSERAIFASTGEEFSWLLGQRARELGITLGEVEEAQYTDPEWDSDDFLVFSLDEEQFWGLNNTTGGTYTIYFGSTPIGPLAPGASDATVQAAFDTALGAGNVEIASFTNTIYDNPQRHPIGTYYGIKFVGNYDGVDVGALTFDTSALVGLTPAVNVTTVQNGGSGLNDIQQIALSNVVGGMLPLQFGASTTAYFSAASTADDVKTYLEGLPEIGPKDIEVTGPAGGPWQVEFVNQLGGVDQALITCPDTSQLVGVPATVSAGVQKTDIDPSIGTWRGSVVTGTVDDYPIQGSPEESTYPYWIWAKVYAVEGLSEDPAGAASRINTLRQYMDEMTPAHLRCAFDWGPIGGFLVDISLVGVDKV